MPRDTNSQTKRTALISQIIGSSGSTLAGVNSNFGDVAQFDRASLSLSNVPSICDTYEVRLPMRNAHIDNG
jgi:hypothetical protein